MSAWLISTLSTALLIGLFFVAGRSPTRRGALFIGRVRHKRTDADGGSLFVNKAAMEMVYWVLDPLIVVHRGAAASRPTW